MHTLYIDTHFNLVLAIFKNDDILLKKEISSNYISKDTIPLLEELLNECNISLNDLKEINVVLGPGSFELWLIIPI